MPYEKKDEWATDWTYTYSKNEWNPLEAGSKDGVEERNPNQKEKGKTQKINSTDWTRVSLGKLDEKLNLYSFPGFPCKREILFIHESEDETILSL